MGVKTTRDVVRPALLEVDRMLVQLRARGEGELANELTMYRDMAVRSVSRHIEREARTANLAQARELVDLMRGDAANG
jgi:hypothetical protein